MITAAELEVAGRRGPTRVKVEDFLRGPKQTSLAPDEIITRVVISLPGPDERVKLYKISKRKEIDTSTFRAAIRIDERGGRIRSAAIAFSGVGPIATRLPQTERFLVGQPFTESTFCQAGKRARAEVEPVSDVRGTSRYRLQLAESILIKFHADSTGAACQEAPLGD